MSRADPEGDLLASLIMRWVLPGCIVSLGLTSLVLEFAWSLWSL